LGEKPLDAAIRETVEEIGLGIVGDELKLFCVHRTYLKAENGAIENEFQWLYSLELNDKTNFTLQSSEVKSLKWVSLAQFKAENKSEQYVPHGELYYNTVASAIKSAE
jgi:isopentenyl-diphosphate Delta-isomerase